MVIFRTFVVSFRARKRLKNHMVLDAGKHFSDVRRNAIHGNPTEPEIKIPCISKL